jgi:hypothetical protein
MPLLKANLCAITRGKRAGSRFAIALHYEAVVTLVATYVHAIVRITATGHYNCAMASVTSMA